MKEILDCTKDTKQSYQLMNNITSSTSTNPMLEGMNDQELAGSFADYFHKKTLKIRDLFVDILPYQPAENSISELSKHTPMIQTEVSAMVIGMTLKHCELDPIPTTILKQMLLTRTPVLTNIINKSLGEGTFCLEWKSSRVIPLIKKQGVDWVMSNYHPVSNLPFLCKMVEKAMFKQFNHCDKYKILPDYQSAYWENYSIGTTLLKLTNDILWAMER